MYKEYSSGLSTQPCGEPVLSVMVDERWGPSFTVCGRFVEVLYPGADGGEA